MANFDEHAACAEALDCLDAYVDGDLSPSEAAALEAHLNDCYACTEELAAARELKARLHGLPKPRCPDRVVERFAERAAWEMKPPAKVRRFPARRWAAALAAAALVLITASVWQFAPRPATAPAYTDAEIALAEQQVKFTLAYLSQVSQRSMTAVGETVIEDKIITPVRDSLLTQLTGGVNFPDTSGS